MALLIPNNLRSAVWVMRIKLLPLYDAKRRDMADFSKRLNRWSPIRNLRRCAFLFAVKFKSIGWVRFPCNCLTNT